MKYTILILLFYISCIGPSKKNDFKISIYLTRALDYNCMYYFDGENGKINCSNNKIRCEQIVPKEVDSIPYYADLLFQEVKPNNHEFNSNEGAYLKIVVDKNGIKDSVVYSGFSVYNEFGELQKINTNLFKIYQSLKPCF